MHDFKIEIQAHTLVWSVSFLVLVMFTFCGHLVVSSDTLRSKNAAFCVCVLKPTKLENLEILEIPEITPVKRPLSS